MQLTKTRKPKPVVSAFTFRAVWPIVERDEGVDTDADLIQLAAADMRNVALRHHAMITGPGRGWVAAGNTIPGTHGTERVVVIEAPADRSPARPYHH